MIQRMLKLFSFIFSKEMKRMLELFESAMNLWNFRVKAREEVAKYYILFFIDQSEAYLI
jgi:hypothetical protein